jgi:serine protease Do
LVGTSPARDIAVLKIVSEDLGVDVREADIADTNNIAIGMKTVVIGNPLAEGFSVTSGIVSVDREQNPDDGNQYIRIDAAVNEGNSGGGLFDIKGQLIGIVTAKVIQDGIENWGYATPINIAASIADRIIEGFGKRCLFGLVTVIESSRTKYNAHKNQIEIIETIKVSEVDEGGLAAGKLITGDQFVSVNLNGGEEVFISRMFHLSDWALRIREGDTIYLTIIRDGEPMTIELEPSAENFTEI